MQNQQLIEARKAKGMTQAELAQAMHVSRQTVSHWENGRVTPDEATWRQLCQLLELQMDNPKTENKPGKKPLWIAAIVVLAAAVLVVGLYFLLPKPRSLNMIGHGIIPSRKRRRMRRSWRLRAKIPCP